MHIIHLNILNKSIIFFVHKAFKIFKNVKKEKRKKDKGFVKLVVTKYAFLVKIKSIFFIYISLIFLFILLYI